MPRWHANLFLVKSLWHLICKENARCDDLVLKQLGYILIEMTKALREPYLRKTGMKEA